MSSFNKIFTFLTMEVFFENQKKPSIKSYNRKKFDHLTGQHKSE